MKKVSVLLLTSWISAISAQTPNSGLSYIHDNQQVMLPPRTYSADAGKKYNHPAYYSHPDFGKLTFYAPYGKRVVEDLGRRTVDSRYYIDLDNPLFFYIEKGAKPINYYKGNDLLAIDPSLSQAAPGLYRASGQPCPTELNTQAGSSAIEIGQERFGFNRFSLRIHKNDGSQQLLNANWSDVRVGNNGCYVTDIFPGIDLRMMYREARVKSEFVVKQNPGVRKLVFIDHLQLSPGLSMQLEAPVVSDHEKGHLNVYNTQTQQLELQIDPARSHDNSGSHTSWFNAYALNGQNLEITCDSLILNGNGRVYPVIVDPLVTAVGPVTAGTTYLAGTAMTPAFCSNSIAVTYPAGTTPWDFSAYWSFYSNWCFGYYTGHGALGDDCWMSEVAVWITSTCGGRTPTVGTSWVCSGCNVPGTWNPTLGFASSGTQSMAQCYAASCSAQTMTFTINQNRSNCTAYSNYDGCSPVSRSYCQTLDNWRVTVQGRSMETLGNTTTGNGTTSATAICFTPYTMNPTPQYGISPYSYNWNPGGGNASTQSVTMTTPGATQTYTATVTDACGTVRTAAFTISNNCVLPIQLTDYTATSDGQRVRLDWTTQSESASDYFTIEKSLDAVHFQALEKVPATGSSNAKSTYRVYDPSPERNAILYYRLQQFDLHNPVAVFSRIVSVNVGPGGEEVLIVPNPATDEITVHLNQEAIQACCVEVSLCNTAGKTVLNKTLSPGQDKVAVRDLPRGVYLVRVTDGARLIGSCKLVLQ